MIRLDVLAALFVLTLGLACKPPVQAREGRTSYNAGVDLIADGEFESGVDLLSAARANSSGDGELRFRSAFVLGEAYAAWADSATAEGAEQAPKPDVIVGRYERAESWFRDAIRQDFSAELTEDARANLAITIKKRRELLDRIGASGRELRARLERVIEDQRGVRDELRKAEAAIAVGQIQADALEASSVTLATAERTLLADVGVVVDIAAGERGELDGIADEERTDEQRGRLAQLSGLIHYLERARTAMNDSRHSLRRNELERAHRRAETAVAELVRAREQLLEPAEVIQGLVAEESTLDRAVATLAALQSGEIKLGESGDAPPIPPFLAADRLSSTQAVLLERAGELSARLGAFLAVSVPTATAPSADQQAAQQAAQVAKAKAVLTRAKPFIDAAVAAMVAAKASLDAGKSTEADPAIKEVVVNLYRALEYFSNLRQLIELTYADHLRAQGLLAPAKADGDQAPTMPVAERQRVLTEIATLGSERLERMTELLADEKLSQIAKASAPAQGQGGQAAAPNEDEVKQAVAAIEARFAKADEHRTAALVAVLEMKSILDAGRGDAIPAAARAQVELEELRRLFFSLIEHLKDLHRRQGETRDLTASAQAAASPESLAASPEEDSSSNDEFAALLPPLVDRESEHAQLANQIGEALAAQADGAQTGGQQSPGAPSPEKLAAAADEVRQATTHIEAAGQKLSTAVTDVGVMSVDLEPAISDQATAIERLAKAIELLTPPKQQDPQDQDQDQDQDQKDQDQKDQDPQDQDPQEQQQQQQQQPNKDVSKSDVERRLRALREEEDKRRKERQNASGGTAVDRDW